MKTAALHNLGCKVNAYETEAMQQLLETAGYQIVDFSQKADVYIINTCSVTNIADKKSRQMLHRAKKQNPDSIVVAAGCYAQSAEEHLKKDASVDLIVGNNKKKDLPAILDSYLASRKEKAPRSYVIDISKTKEYEDLHIRKIADHTRAFLKVQDGCNQFCSYCIIPYTRGRIRSRRLEEVAEETRCLVEKGYKEMVLTGIHLSSYGKDFPEGEKTGLIDLIRQVHAIDGVERIRLGSLEPRIVTEEFAKELSSMPKVCPHFHLSLQSGSAATLKRMNRHYTPEEYLEGCRRLRRAFDNPAITTDVIAGFPGETEEEFDETRKFLEKADFYEMHIFKYSRREGTKADKMPDQVPEEVKSQRSSILLDLERAMSLRYRKSFLGKECCILLEDEVTLEGRQYYIGHTPEYVRMAVPKEEGGIKKGMFVLGTAITMLDDEVVLLQEKLRK
ncbi:MAG: tRNA (N(6)-L-threonylcarbamoyladenosine(37)-C(2))-methylthiotransferase MtaB [Lachnospiraceae bacterium]